MTLIIAWTPYFLLFLPRGLLAFRPYFTSYRATIPRKYVIADTTMTAPDGGRPTWRVSQESRPAALSA